MKNRGRKWAKRSAYPISSSPLYKLRSRSRLASLLGLSNAELRRLTKGNERYREFDIPKKTGGARHVENPARSLKIVQARLAELLMRIAPPDYLFCPVRGRSYVTNAARHVGNRAVRCLDIKTFFPSTKARRVFWFFSKILQCARDVAGLLTEVATYEGHLPTGSPLSPILAYFAHIDMWEAIGKFCDSQGFILTVYVDDCTISGEKVAARDVWEIKQMIFKSGLRYHKEKAYFDKPAEVTGAILLNGTMTVPNRQLLKLKRARTEFALASEERQRKIDSQINGLRGQVRQIKALGVSLRTSGNTQTSTS